MNSLLLLAGKLIVVEVAATRDYRLGRKNFVQPSTEI